jgi:hypothetical protein
MALFVKLAVPSVEFVIERDMGFIAINSLNRLNVVGIFWVFSDKGSFYRFLAFIVLVVPCLDNF